MCLKSCEEDTSNMNLFSAVFSLGWCVLLLQVVEIDAKCELTPFSRFTSSVDDIRTNVQKTIDYSKAIIGEIDSEKKITIDMEKWLIIAQIKADYSRIQGLSKIPDHPDACLLKTRIDELTKLLEDAERQSIFMTQAKTQTAVILRMLKLIEKEQKYMQDKYSVSHTLESSIKTLIRTTCGSRYEKRYPTGSIQKIQVLDPPHCKR